jgi:hypothetical protein
MKHYPECDVMQETGDERWFLPGPSTGLPVPAGVRAKG